MIRISDMTDAWAAAWSMAKGDPAWSEQLDMSAPAVFRSFWAMALAVPAMLISLEAQRRIIAENPEVMQTDPLTALPPGVYVPLMLLSSLGVWLAELGFLVLIGQRRGVGWKISPLIITMNWTKALLMAVSALAITVPLAMSAPALALLGGVGSFALLIYIRWGIVRRTLDFTGKGTAAMLGALVLVAIAASMVARLILEIIVGLLGVAPSTGSPTII